MSIDLKTAAHVAKLARIQVDDAALPALASEFNAVLGFIEQLNEVDIEGVEPMTSVTPMRLKRRDDLVNGSVGFKFSPSDRSRIIINDQDITAGRHDQIIRKREVDTRKPPTAQGNCVVRRIGDIAR